MDDPVLTNADEFPDDAVISRTLGPVKTAWDAFNELIGSYDPVIAGEWRYYKDGHSWLYKVTRKKQTVCWVSVYPGKFRTTFYFPDRAEPLISESGLSAELIDQFVKGKHYGKIRGLTLEITDSADLEAVRILIGIKEKIK